MAPSGDEVNIGQTWEEVDPRFTRRVTVIAFDHFKSWKPQNGINGGVGTMLVPHVRIEGGGRRTWARLDRFTGKRGGYRLVTDKAADRKELEASK
jgi:hypothetical protein